MNTVTQVINEAHLSTNSTLGKCAEIEVYGEPLNPSINYSSAYAFKSIDELGAYHENKFDSIRYTRDSSLIVRQLEHYFSLMHSKHLALMFNSGMGAISATFSAVVTSKSRIITFGSFYRKSLSIFQGYQKNFGVEYINVTSLDELENLNSEDTIVFIESPSNPFLELVDIQAVRTALPDAKIILDSTFQGLLNSKSSYKGVDIVLASCTKYIGGHNDLLAGYVICLNQSLYSRVWDERSMRGGIIDNQSAYLLLRSLRTYDLRVNKTLENMSHVLKFLDDSPVVENIYYPGQYENAAQSGLFESEHYHGGGVVTFRVSENVSLNQNLEKLCSTKMAPSFGSVDSLVEIPMYMSHWGKSLDEVKQLGLDERTVRFSVGNEPIQYILNDLIKLLKTK
ncbi:MAG: PLP-dependent transferase [Methyloprofundus sp.]|nr:PLP-dependent transferase [Methyloprofundus sp.]